MSAWSDQAAVTTVATPQQVDQFHRDGFFVLPCAFHTDTIADVLGAVALEAGLADATLLALRADEPPGDVLRRFCSHPLLAGLARDFVGPEAYLCADSAVLTPDPSTANPFTHEAPSTTPPGPPRLTCWVALTDFTLESGCLQIGSGAHRADRPVDDPPVVIDVETGAGSVVVMSSLTPRRLLARPGSRTTVAYSIQYAREIVVDLDDLLAPPRRLMPVVRNGQLVGPT